MVQGRACARSTMDVPPQDVITRDNVSVKVNAVIYFRVVDPERAVVEVENYLYATSQIAQTTLRSVLRPGGARRAAGRAREDQPGAAADHRPPHRALGRSRCHGRGQAHRPAAGDAARHGRARPRPSASAAPRSSTPRASSRRRRAGGGGGGHRRAAGRRAAALPADAAEIATENNSTTIFPVPIDLLGPLLAATAAPTASVKVVREPRLSSCRMARSGRPASGGTGNAAQPGRARRSQRRGRGFESLTLHHHTSRVVSSHSTPLVAPGGNRGR